MLGRGLSALLAANKARQALHAAAQMASLQLVEFPQLEFAKQSEAELVQQLSRAQQVAARLEPAVGALYDALAEGETDRATLTGPRWQAGFDLALGRAAAAKTPLKVTTPCSPR